MRIPAVFDPGVPVRSGSPARLLRLAVRFYLPVAAAACMILAVLLVLGVPAPSRGGSLVALGAAGVGALAIAVRCLRDPSEPERGSSPGSALGAPHSPPEAAGSPRDRRPDLNHRVLPLYSSVPVGQLRSGGPVVSVLARPPDERLLGAGSRPTPSLSPLPPPAAVPPRSGRSPDTDRPAPSPGAPWSRGTSTAVSSARAGPATGIPALWEEATNPLPPHLRSPIEDNLSHRAPAPFERRLPRGRTGEVRPFRDRWFT